MSGILLSQAFSTLGWLGTEGAGIVSQFAGMDWRLCEPELGQTDVPRAQRMATQLFLRTVSLEEEGTKQGVFDLRASR